MTYEEARSYLDYINRTGIVLGTFAGGTGESSEPAEVYP